jgi:thiamine-monophosphate kinase
VKLKEIGEFGFIDRFTPWFRDLIKDNQIGIGDDCAIISVSDTEDWLVTTDLLMEDIHFLRNAITPWQLGYKSLAVNLSDIAAMGGSPIGSFLSIGIPEDIEVENLDAFMKGYHELSEKYHVPLLGGDTTKSLIHLAINVCVIGKCPKGKAKKRSMAQAGDIIYVTGNLGDSAAGLKILLEKPALSAECDFLLEKHYKPEPRIKEGLFLSSFPEVHAMMDISDGIASDLFHILKASGKKATVETDKLPLSKELIKFAEEQHWDMIELATAGGEDFELLLTVDPEKSSMLESDFLNYFGTPLFPIGTIFDGDPHVQWMKDGIEYQFSKSGFNHFV